MSDDGTVAPFVHWGQTDKTVVLKVDLRDVKKPTVVLENGLLKFNAFGYGVHGKRDYSFELKLFGETSQQPDVTTTDHNIRIILKKTSNALESVEWQRLTASTEKLHWLRVDFDLLAANIEDSDKEDPRDFPNQYGDWKASEEMDEFVDSEVTFTMVYLAFYNGLQFVGYFYIFLKLFVYMFVLPDAPHQAWTLVGTSVKYTQGLAILEVLNPIMGFVKSSPVTAAMQVFGRNLVLFGLIDRLEPLQIHPITYYMFLTWASVELIRYPFYIVQSFQYQWYPLTWLRYTIWYVLYPIGFVCEFYEQWLALPLVKATPIWTLKLPNVANISFSFEYFLIAYMTIFFVGAFVLYSHMHRQRSKALAKARKTKTA